MSTAKQYVARVGEAERNLTVEPIEPLAEGRWRVVIDGNERIVRAQRVDGTAWLLELDGRVIRLDVDAGKDGDPQVELGSVQVPVKLLDPRQQRLEAAKAVASRAKGPAGPEVVRSPMPGKVVKVLVKVGDEVPAGHGVAVVEAMKMENELKAGRGGKVVQVHASEGQALEAQQPVVTIE
jgi:biotin carboxyl carrier protein